MRENDLFNIHLNEETELDDYKKYLEREGDLGYLESMNDISDFSIREFVSRSNGKDRKPRKKPREITMVKYKDTTYYSENGGDIKARKSRSIGLDILAREVLENTGVEPTVDNLLTTIRCYDEIKQRVKRYNRP